MMTEQCSYKEMVLNSAQLIVPREIYQRRMNAARVMKIAKNFDERVANEPKVSYRNDKYYVFDGQHTIAARKLLNGGRDLPIKCKVYFNMSREEEALLFAQQTGESAPLSAGSRLRALISGKDAEALSFLTATKSVGLLLDYDQARGSYRIGCVQTAFNIYKKIGEERYKEAMAILANAWSGEPNSFRAENVIGVSNFIDLYHGEYSSHRLLTQLRNVDPLTICRRGQAMGTGLSGYKKYLYQVYRIYNGSRKNVLPMKF